MTASPILLFDGRCVLCDFWVQFVIRHDPQAVFRFAAFQSQTGRELCQTHGIDPEKMASLVLIDPSGVHRQSDAVLTIVERWGGAWRFLGAAGRIVPRPWRDGLYDWVARNRTRWFGRRSACRVPSDALRQRFLP
jgi:predicted DCC family thiol-disulfide oxidoreductase YuxK